MTPVKTSDSKDWLFRGILTILVSITLYNTFAAFRLLKTAMPLIEEQRKINIRQDILIQNLEDAHSRHLQSDFQEHTRLWERFANERQVQQVP